MPVDLIGAAISQVSGQGCPRLNSLINDKHEGPYLRLKTLPVPLHSVMGAKVMLYLLVCLVQFIFMLLIGVYLFHLLFNIPRLEIGSSFLALVVATLAAAFAAVGFGMLVGAGSRSHAQAALDARRRRQETRIPAHLGCDRTPT